MRSSRLHRPIALAAALWMGAAAVCAATERPRVVVTIYPLYEWACAVGGKDCEVFQLVPPGANAHLYSPRPADVLRLRRSDLFLYLHEAMEPWAADLARSVGSSNLVIVEVAGGIELSPGVGRRRGGQGSRERGRDPHVWLDPVLAQELVQVVADAFSRVDPENASEYRRNAEAYIARLKDLDGYIRRRLADCPQRTVFYAGPFPFSYFARRYGIDFHLLYRSTSAEAHIAPRDMAQMVREVRAAGAKVIFHAELFDPRAARAVAAETGARVVGLHGLHNLRPAEKAQGLGYIELMKRNADRLAEALGCR